MLGHGPIIGEQEANKPTADERGVPSRLRKLYRVGMDQLSGLPPVELTRKAQELLQKTCPDKESEVFFGSNMRLAKGMGLTWLEGLQFVVEQRRRLN